jgi:hypothetical protein
LKEFLTREVLTRLDDTGNAPILNFHNVFFAALAAKLEFDFCAAHHGVTVFHSGQAI